MELDQATLVGLKAYLWNEELAHHHVPPYHALFAVRRAEDKLVQRVLPFRIDDATTHGSDGYLHQGATISSIISSMLLFEERLMMELGEEINLLLYSSLRFTPHPPHSPTTPRLVIVADISYTEVKYVDDEPDHMVEYTEVMFSDDEQDMVEYTSDIEDGLSYDDQMIEILEKLRMLYRPVMLYPSEPPYPSDPTVLTEQKLKIEIGVYKEAEESTDCVICLDAMAAGEMVLETACGHVFHKTCSIPWFSAAFTCPMCLADTFTIL